MRRHRPLGLALPPTSAPVTRRPCTLTASALAHHAHAPLRDPGRALHIPPVAAARPPGIGVLARPSRF
jgi:hypothetical protein